MTRRRRRRKKRWKNRGREAGMCFLFFCIQKPSEKSRQAYVKSITIQAKNIIVGSLFFNPQSMNYKAKNV